jgi:hypothetical protein
MGNRAIVKPEGKNIGVYLHWNGGIDSVTAFLKYCELRRFRDFDDSYGLARFCQVVGNFFGGSLSIGIYDNVGETQRDAKYMDNGIYVVKGWKIVRHVGRSERREGYDLDDILKEIDSKQPSNEQLGEFLDGVETDISEIEVGDMVFVESIEGRFEKWEVVGIGEDRMVNGRNVLGVPYVDKWTHGPDNPNNYLYGKVRRVIK